MAGIYSSVTDFQNSPTGQALKLHWQQLPQGTLDQILLQASAEVDGFVGRKLAAPVTTTLLANASIGATTVQVTTTAGFYPHDALALPSENSEIWSVDYQTPYSSPYPGTLSLVTPLKQAYAAGTTVTGYRQDRFRIRGQKLNPIDKATQMSQEAQIASLHAPRGSADSSRYVFLKEYPVVSLFAMFRALPWSGYEGPIDFSTFYLDAEKGIVQLPVGYYNPLGSKWRTQYIAGFGAVPWDVRDAVHLYMASTVSRMMNPLGAIEIAGGAQRALLTQRTHSASGQTPRPLFIDEAERKLAGYVRKGR